MSGRPSQAKSRTGLGVSSLRAGARKGLVGTSSSGASTAAPVEQPVDLPSMAQLFQLTTEEERAQGIIVVSGDLATLVYEAYGSEEPDWHPVIDAEAFEADEDILPEDMLEPDDMDDLPDGEPDSSELSTIEEATGRGSMRPPASKRRKPSISFEDDVPTTA